MQSKALDVGTYLQEAPEERREVLTAIRQLCLEELKGHEEGMEYGMPSYSRDGTVEVGFASQKNYISLYILTDVMAANADLLASLKVGKGCIRYSSPKRVDLGTVRKLLADTNASSGPVC